ncbi:chemotaxis protein CheB [Spirosoma flavum]|uniref:protein-glutamate methylesterase n=1 Tax=Spirosoma flavum TaxID=2048557 RepID=A0ABW6ATQ4_9BACT
MAKRDIVVIGASAGGVMALRELVSAFPADFQAPVFIIQHVSSTSPSLMPEILSRSGPLKVIHPQDGAPIQAGYIYIAPPDHHMILENDRILVKKGPKENRFRPSIDALFRSAAYTFGSRVIGVVLTGLLNDGTSGMWSIKRLGGIGIVQQPEDAAYPSMPTSVLEYVDVDYVLPLSDIGALICKLTQEQAALTPELTAHELDRLEIEVSVAAQGDAFDMGILTMGELSPLTCPECSGVLVRFDEGRLIRYRCHTGHGYTSDALLSELTESVEASLWKTLRGLEETIILLEQSSEVLSDADDTTIADQFTKKAQETRKLAQAIRKLTYNHEQYSEEDLVEKAREGE